MIFELPKLKYKVNDLAPYISENTVNYHYGKHHKTYVDNVNKLIIGTEFENSSLEEIIKKSSGPIFNNGAQVWNHTFYWESLTPGGSGLPTGKIMDLISKTYGSYDNFKEKFTASCLGLFGSGWVWLVLKSDGNLDIVQCSNAENPLRNGLKLL